MWIFRPSSIPARSKSGAKVLISIELDPIPEEIHTEEKMEIDGVVTSWFDLFLARMVHPSQELKNDSSHGIDEILPYMQQFIQEDVNNIILSIRTFFFNGDEK